MTAPTNALTSGRGLQLVNPGGAFRGGVPDSHRHAAWRTPGFGLRVARAKSALRRLGADCLAHIYTRGFDNCFEMFDGDAVVWALMHAAVGGDVLLERGIRNMGNAVWPHWLEVYEQRSKHASDANQLSFV